MSSTDILANRATEGMSIGLATSTSRWPTICAPSRRPVARSPVIRIESRVRSRVIRLVIEGARTDGERIQAGCTRIGVTKAGARGSELEDLDHLRPERSLEDPVAPDGALPRYLPLLVGGLPQGKIGRLDGAAR